MNMFGEMFGKVANGMCRLSMNGNVAVKTSNGYKTYNLETNTLTNCDNFVFDIGEEFFFVIPTNKVKPGDIILVTGKPKCVISVGKQTIKVIDYEDSTVKDILPERHVFMGNSYFYGKIVSMFGDNFLKDKTGLDKIMSYMLLSEIMKSGNGTNNLSGILPLIMISGNNNLSGLFDGIFNTDIEETNDKEK